jgi:hypothetical protein
MITNPFQYWARVAELQMKAAATSAIAFGSVGPAIAYEIERERQTARIRAERAERTAAFRMERRQREIAASL